MKSLIIYSSASATKNTREIGRHIHQAMGNIDMNVDFLSIREFGDLERISEYDIVVVGTYSWGNGKIPRQMRPLADYFEQHPNKNLVTGVFGSGDSFYPRFCGAVDQFKALLSNTTNLAVTLKVELYPQDEDIAKVSKFAELIKKRYMTA
ncbi:flavodoxin domain-containing protein [Bacillus atrophaeus]|uniref:flavodoxin domain-containing protein n=1 Tax=Bacillus atrophaeus TaxID=1452 RepID=UPI002E21ED08|nr:flavodoxin domain-containing protein [Bacillus atrophaeus]